MSGLLTGEARPTNMRPDMNELPGYSLGEVRCTERQAKMLATQRLIPPHLEGAAQRALSVRIRRHRFCSVSAIHFDFSGAQKNFRGWNVIPTPEVRHGKKSRIFEWANRPFRPLYLSSLGARTIADAHRGVNELPTIPAASLTILNLLYNNKLRERLAAAGLCSQPVLRQEVAVISGSGLLPARRAEFLHKLF
jgi:hypothetical protein